MYSLLFERPLLFFLGWVSLQFVLICLWSWRRTKLARQATIAGLIALPVGLALSQFVVTPAEEVMAKCQSLAAAVDEGDMATIAAGVAAGFEASGLSREEFLARVEQTLTRIRIDRPRLSRFEIETAEHDAVAEFSVTCRIRSEDFTLEALPTRWRVSFRNRSGDWLVTSIESIPVPPLNLRTVDDWLR